MDPNYPVYKKAEITRIKEELSLEERRDINEMMRENARKGEKTKGLCYGKRGTGRRFFRP